MHEDKWGIEERKKIVHIMAKAHVPLNILEDSTERDLRNTHINNTEELRGAMDSHTPSQESSPTRTDAKHHKVSRPDISTTYPTSSHARRSTSVTYLRTTHHRMRGRPMRSQNSESACMTGVRSSERSTQRRERRRLPSGSLTSTSRTTLIGTLHRSCRRPV